MKRGETIVVCKPSLYLLHAGGKPEKVIAVPLKEIPPTCIKWKGLPIKIKAHDDERR